MLRGQVQSRLVQPASSVDLRSLVQQVAGDLHVAPPSSVVQGCEVQRVPSVHLSSPGYQQLDGRQVSPGSSPVQRRAAMPVPEAWVRPVAQQHLNVLEGGDRGHLSLNVGGAGAGRSHLSATC